VTPFPIGASSRREALNVLRWIGWSWLSLSCWGRSPWMMPQCPPTGSAPSGAALRRREWRAMLASGRRWRLTAPTPARRNAPVGARTCRVPSCCDDCLIRGDRPRAVLDAGLSVGRASAVGRVPMGTIAMEMSAALSGYDSARGMPSRTRQSVVLPSRRSRAASGQLRRVPCGEPAHLMSLKAPLCRTITSTTQV